MITSEQWIQEGIWYEVTSSNVKAIRYDKEARELYVQFLGRSKNIFQPVYIYLQVSDTIAETMFQAASYGKFVWQYLRDTFSFRGPYSRTNYVWKSRTRKEERTPEEVQGHMARQKTYWERMHESREQKKKEEVKKHMDRQKSYWEKLHQEEEEDQS